MIDNNIVYRLVIQKMLHRQDRLDSEYNSRLGQLYSQSSF